VCSEWEEPAVNIDICSFTNKPDVKLKGEVTTRFMDGSDILKFKSFCDSMSIRIVDELKTISLSCWDIEQKRIAIVNFRMDQESTNSI